MTSQTWRRACGSRPVVGSSRKRISGSPTSATASERRCFCPPESLRTQAFSFSSSRTMRMTSCGVQPLGVEAPEQRDRLQDRELLGQLGLLELDADPLAQERASRDQLQPSTCTVPASGSLRPSRISTVVVFPAPLGPRRPKHSPARIEGRRRRPRRRRRTS